MNFSSFLPDIFASIIAGILLAILFFLAREKWFAINNLAGKWYFQVTTEKTAYNPYKDMTLRYVVFLYPTSQNSWKGTAEKFYEKSITGTHEYVGVDRTRAEVEFFVEKRVIDRHKATVHLIEQGRGREYSSCHLLELQPNGHLIGSFQSTAADQEGSAIWQRNPF